MFSLRFPSISHSFPILFPFSPILAILFFAYVIPIFPSLFLFSNHFNPMFLLFFSFFLYFYAYVSPVVPISPIFRIQCKPGIPIFFPIFLLNCGLEVFQD